MPGGAQVNAAAVDAHDFLYPLQAGERAHHAHPGAVGGDTGHIQNGPVGHGLGCGRHGDGHAPVGGDGIRVDEGHGLVDDAGEQAPHRGQAQHVHVLGGELAPGLYL